MADFTNVIHKTPHGYWLVARKLLDGRYAAYVHEAFRKVWGTARIGTMEEVIPVGYVYASASNARARAATLYPRG
jgi:hypothetical protein